MVVCLSLCLSVVYYSEYSLFLKLAQKCYRSCSKLSVRYIHSGYNVNRNVCTTVLIRLWCKVNKYWSSCNSSLVKQLFCVLVYKT